MIKRLINRRIFLWLPMTALIILIAVSGCGTKQEAAGAETATAQENARGTQQVEQAQAMATALIETLVASNSTVAPQAPAQETPTVNSPVPGSTLTPEATSGGVEVVAVTTAADGAYIMVQFRAPVRVARGWYQGKVWVKDEATGNLYAEIPSVGVIGPLITKPATDGQLGFVMLTNKPNPLKVGDVVTVVLGDFKQEHLVIQ